MLDPQDKTMLCQKEIKTSMKLLRFLGKGYETKDQGYA